MASRRSPRHFRLLKRQRSSLVKELPEPADLLNFPELGAKFSAYEKGEILKEKVRHRRAEKFLDYLEMRPPEVFEVFLKALKSISPMLADKLRDEAEAEGSSGSKYVRMADMNGVGDDDECIFPVQEVGGQFPQDNAEEEGGVYGLNGPGLNRNRRHMSCLNYESREFLAGKLNGTKPDRNIFRSFCRAMEVEERLENVSINSRNPTAYLIQKLSEERDGTMSRLAKALERLDMTDVYDDLLTKI